MKAFAAVFEVGRHAYEFPKLALRQKLKKVVYVKWHPFTVVLKMYEAKITEKISAHFSKLSP